jgi:uncharacterized protein involved in type VI secretion and phage assembly
VTSELYEGIARIARHEAGARASAALGEVTASHGADGSPPEHSVDVQLRDSGIVLPHVPVAVGQLGFAALPDVGELVLVVFLDGDANAPVVAGRLYTADLEPPKQGKKGITALELPTGSSPALKLEVDAAKPTAKLEMGSAPLKLTIDADQVAVEVDGVKITATKAGGGRVELAAGGSKITLKKDGDVTISSAGKLALSGTEVTIDGQQKVSASGAQVEINAQAKAKVAGAMVELG